MAYENLSDFLNELQDDGELVRVSAEVDPVLEITEIADRISKRPRGGPALFFENVKGSTLPVLVNLLGSHKRLLRALGAKSFADVAERIPELLKPQSAEGWLDKLKLVPTAAGASKFVPRAVRTAACQQVVKLGRDVDLTEFPVLKNWPGDAARSISFGQVLTRHPATGVRHAGNFHLPVHDTNSCLIHWHRQQEAWHDFVEFKKLGIQMPIAVSFGGDPAFPLMAFAPRLPESDPFLLAGLLRGAPCDLVKCRSIDMEVPANAEIVLEGYVDPTEPWQMDGAYGGPTGYYSVPRLCPVYHITAVTQRANPIYPTTVFGIPPTECYWINKACERIFLPLVKAAIPEFVDYNFPQAGGGRQMLFVSIRKTYPQQARKVLNALWGLWPTLMAKIVVIVDEHVDVQDEHQVWFRVASNVHPGRDVVFNSVPTDAADHAAPVEGVGQPMGIDATAKFPEEAHPRPWPGDLVMPGEIKDLVTNRWAQYGLGRLPTEPAT
ncbi:MAG: UbiD family decarboxylase [Planctomycetes bacterium]|nr:UbiD family decarboxylase [Planctomycetota bacterium]